MDATTTWTRFERHPGHGWLAMAVNMDEAQMRREMADRGVSPDSLHPDVRWMRNDVVEVFPGVVDELLGWVDSELEGTSVHTDARAEVESVRAVMPGDDDE